MTRVKIEQRPLGRPSPLHAFGGQPYLSRRLEWVALFEDRLPLGRLFGFSAHADPVRASSRETRFIVIQERQIAQRASNCPQDGTRGFSPICSPLTLSHSCPREV